MPNEAYETHKQITVLVNGADVGLTHHGNTGASIKQAAIAAGVPIEPDFVLYARHPHTAEYIKVDDDKVIEVHAHEHFRAVAPDDVA